MWQHLLRDGDSRGHAGENDLVHDALADVAVTEAFLHGTLEIRKSTQGSQVRGGQKKKHRTTFLFLDVVIFHFSCFFFFLRTFSTIGP